MHQRRSSAPQRSRGSFPSDLTLGELEERLSDRRSAENQSLRSPSLIVLLMLATLGVGAYAVFLLNPANRGDLLPFLLVICAELVLVTQALFSMWTILSGTEDPRDFDFHAAKRQLFMPRPPELRNVPQAPQDRAMRLKGARIDVDIFITVYGEDLEVIERTVRAALAMHGEHATWILDDGRSDEVRDLADRLGARYIRRLSSNGAKAGNVNHALSISSGQFYAIFDADFVPKPDFLIETLPFFASDNVAFVQTPQTYGNLGASAIAKGAGYMQSVFYRLVQPGRNRFNAAFCVGTNVVFRREAVEEIGGMYTDSKSEDVWTSLRLHEHGWRSIYIPVTLAVGDAPETVEAFSKQQLRWATGGFEILFTHNPLSPRRRLTTDQRLQYLVTATHYLVGITPLLLLMVPPLEIFFDLRPVNLTVTGATWALYYLGFYGLQIVLAFAIMGSFRPQVLMLATVSFPIYMKALHNVVGGRDQAWQATGDRQGRRSPFNFIVPQVSVFVFLLISTAVAAYKDWGNGIFTLATAWNATNTFVFGAFICVAFAEISRGRAERRATASARHRAPTVDSPVQLEVRA